MEYPWIRVVLFTIFAIYDIGMALYYSYVMELPTNVSRRFPLYASGNLEKLCIL